MATAYFSKVVSTLPSPLVANTLYCVRTGVGFDLYLTDSTASIAYKTNSATGATGATGNSLQRPTQSISSASGVVTIDLANPYEVYTLTLTENVTSWVFNNVPAAGFTAELRVRITQGASTAYTCVSPATSGMTAGGIWVNSSALGAIESLGVAISSSGNKTVFPSGVYA